MIPPQDNFPAQLQRVISRFLAEGRAAGVEELGPIAYRLRELPPRPTLSLAQRLSIYQRDGWLCRYCGGETILTQVMALLGSLFPDLFRYHPNWKTGATHPAIISRSASVDHLYPGSLGGSWTEPDNLATACWLCNMRKADLTLEQLGWSILTAPETSQWDGLTGLSPRCGRLPGNRGENIERGLQPCVSLLAGPDGSNMDRGNRGA